ncbi:uncharacterized protein LOC116195555 [Punica granatum]|uniref:Uncharacterized protein n=2 Tax=Punica granatum TaxID=22663 RepID=A0A218WU00_PUNGR|nr:uncharacterized protein LOC116195555 [Punica granatum]OWM75432.1 hypothetical protein CDL15_Pgr021596 [Punica granatum]PKI35525.1 hypothetical protein CRG98_043979 [Punica granatum]
MAVATAALAKLQAARGARDEVYVAAVALRATRGPAQMAMSVAYSLNLWGLQHFMVLIRPSSSSAPPPQIYVFDFQPTEPENIYVALAALSGRSIAGSVLRRKLKRLPKERCWLVGSSGADAVEASLKFNESWKTDLRIGHHDCRDYTNALVEYLTGERNVLERLRSSTVK